MLPLKIAWQKIGRMEIITFTPYTLLYITERKDKKNLWILQTPEEVFDVWAKKWDAAASLAFAFKKHFSLTLNRCALSQWANEEWKKYLESSQEEDARTHQSSRRICYHWTFTRLFSSVSILINHCKGSGFLWHDKIIARKSHSWSKKSRIHTAKHPLKPWNNNEQTPKCTSIQCHKTSWLHLIIYIRVRNSIITNVKTVVLH